ncbi:MAG TPA: hypothetical protein VGT41_03615 [Candidatus Babeliales bacterium]|nr:hypothetical protein [Candidatus Babeliales bacterium]
MKRIVLLYTTLLLATNNAYGMFARTYMPTPATRHSVIRFLEAQKTIADLQRLQAKFPTAVVDRYKTVHSLY